MSTSLPDRRYWSERQGRGPRGDPLTIEQLRRLVFSSLDELFERYFFQEAFGYHCVDDGDMPGLVGQDANAWFLRRLHRDDIWPYRAKGDRYDEDTLFDVLEALHDLVSAPVHGRFHDFAGCGWHYGIFDKLKGQQEFRSVINPALERFEQPLQMTPAGEIILLGPAEFRPLLEAPLPTNADADLVTARVDEAVRIFRGRGSTKAERRQAVRELADVLEVLRPDIKDELLPKDERELFRIANGFAIRHNNRDQRHDYDDAIWLSWVFWVYLATIHAVLRLRDKQRDSGA
jgi:hypothetical protein